MYIGIDEVGRGALAGPVMAAAVVLLKDIKGLKDSKKLIPKQRQALYNELQDNSLYAIGEASVAEINEFNILNATMLAMRRAFKKLNIENGIALIDGISDPKLTCPTKLIIKGDNYIPVISAASILAKVTRDNLMCHLHTQFSYYGWQQNKGYGTKLHIEQIRKNGISIHHRKSFLKFL